jgi:hypothetical protein
MSEYSKYIVNLIILTIGIIIIIVAKNSTDTFVANISWIPPIGNGNGYVNSVGSNLNEQPMRFREDIYPARVPWYPEYGRPCTDGQCGATGICKDGTCEMRRTDRTAFNVPY